MSDVNVHTLDGCAGSDHGSCPQYGRVKVDVVELGSCSLELSLWLGSIASNGNTLRGHQTEFRLLHVKRLISDYARVVIVARTTEWPLALADQGGPVDSTVQLL